MNLFMSLPRFWPPREGAKNIVKTKVFEWLRETSKNNKYKENGRIQMDAFIWICRAVGSAPHGAGPCCPGFEVQPGISKGVALWVTPRRSDTAHLVCGVTAHIRYRAVTPHGVRCHCIHTVQGIGAYGVGDVLCGSMQYRVCRERAMASALFYWCGVRDVLHSLSLCNVQLPGVNLQP